MNEDKKHSVYSIKGVLKESSGEMLHHHVCHQVMVINNGISLLVDDFAQKPLYGNMCSFIPAGVEHRTVVIGSQVNYQCMFIPDHLYTEYRKEIVVFSGSELGLALFNRLVNESLTAPGCAIRNDCFKLFLKVLSEDIFSAVELAHLPVTGDDKIKKIISFIEQNYYRRIHLDNLKSLFPYTARHISRIFKKELGISIFEYIKLYRLFMSTVMLVDSDKQIIEAASDCGYDSLSAFYKDFKFYFGMTPKQFRRRL